MTLELELIEAGLPAEEVRQFSVPKMNWLGNLLHRLRCNNALLYSLAINNPKKCGELRDSFIDEGWQATEDEWEPPSMDRLKRNLEKKHGAKS